MARLHRLGVLALLAAATVLASAAPASAAGGFSAGAAKIVTTPPAAGSPEGDAADSKFAPEFANCPGAVFPDRGRFALQEPFVDENGNGQWDDVDSNGNPNPEPYCDANGNGRWDGIYSSGKNDTPMTKVHDDIEARAFAISSGGKPLVVVSVVQQGLFENYDDLMRDQLKSTYGVDADMIVSADHNESSPDSVGIYGAGTLPGVDVGARSGVDEYFMKYLEDRVAHVAADAVNAMVPADLYANQIAVPTGKISQRYSEQFPTFVATAAEPHVPAAVDQKIGLLQARDAQGTPVFTVMSYAAHNQEMGHSALGAQLSSDWPGAFARAFDAKHDGVSLFLVGDNGSQEDPSGLKDGEFVIPKGSENGGPQQDVQAQYTGEVFADVVDGMQAGATQLAPGAVALHRTDFCVPLENNGFLALFAAGDFGTRTPYLCDPSGAPVTPSRAGRDLRTYASYASIGPDLQLITNPGEAFPALMLGSPFGKEDESCDEPNPQVPTWHAKSAYRFQVGLADDMIGYMIPAWGYFGSPPGLFQSTCVNSNDPSSSDDSNGHSHKLESEGVGPTASNDVANRSAGLLDAEKDPVAQIAGGRYVLADGKLSHRPGGAVGVIVADAGATKVGPDGGVFVGFPGMQGAGGRAVDASGVPMDYDGQPPPDPDVLTRGAEVFDSNGCASARYYVSVFDPLTEKSMGAVQTTPGLPVPGENCKHDDGTQDDTNNGKGDTISGEPPVQGGVGGDGTGGGVAGNCNDRTPPHATVAGKRRLRGRRLRLHGRASDRGCGKDKNGSLARVTITVLRHTSKRRCVFAGPNGRLGSARACSKPIQLLANGARKWSFRKKFALLRGTYTVLVRAFDAAGNGQASRRRLGGTVLTLRR